MATKATTKMAKGKVTGAAAEAKPKGAPMKAGPVAAKPKAAKPSPSPTKDKDKDKDSAGAAKALDKTAREKALERAPDFKLQADDGSTVSLADLAGKRIVLYFYPKDNTPGCTREACAFQENLAAIRKAGAVVLGVSRDSAKTHAGFKSKYGLAFPLLSDPDAAVHKAYGAWGTKKSYGREMTGALRATVIIDGSGRIVKRFPSVKVDGHAKQVLDALKAS